MVLCARSSVSYMVKIIGSFKYLQYTEEFSSALATAEGGGVGSLLKLCDIGDHTSNLSRVNLTNTTFTHKTKCHFHSVYRITLSCLFLQCAMCNVALFYVTGCRTNLNNT